MYWKSNVSISTVSIPETILTLLNPWPLYRINRIQSCRPCIKTQERFLKDDKSILGKLTANIHDRYHLL